MYNLYTVQCVGINFIQGIYSSSFVVVKLNLLHLFSGFGVKLSLEKFLVCKCEVSVLLPFTLSKYYRCGPPNKSTQHDYGTKYRMNSKLSCIIFSCF